MNNNTKTITKRLNSMHGAGIAACLALASPLALATPGNLDITFGSDGKVLTSFAPASLESAGLAAQPDGKIVQVGNVQDENLAVDALLLRYNPDGSLDTAFGSGGKVTTDYGEIYDGAKAVKILADGKILTAGSATSQGNTSNMVVARYNSDGALDTGFGANGIAVISFGAGSFAEGNALLVQSDGKIVVAGRLKSADGGDFALARLLPDGSLDSGFGTGGKMSADFGGIEQNGLGAALQSSGKILIAGYNKSGNEEVVAIARFKADGSVDTGFGQNGLAQGDFGDQYAHAYGVAVQADDAIVVAGNRGQSQVQPFTEFCMAARFSKDGALDGGFATSGVFTGGAGACQDVVVAASDQLLLVGGNADQSSFTVYRLDAAGRPDSGFGSEGQVSIGFDSSTFVFGKKLALIGDGKAVVSGGVFGAVATDVGLARLDVGSAPANTNTNTDDTDINTDTPSETVDDASSDTATGPSIALTAPPTWRQGQKQVLAWTSRQIAGSRNVKLQFSKNGGAKFKTLRALANQKGRLTWKPTKAHITQQGVLRICTKPAKRAADVCDSVGIVVLPKS